MLATLQAAELVAVKLRYVRVHCVCVCLWQLSRSLRCLSSDETLWLQVISNIKHKFAHHQQSSYRQLYVPLYWCTQWHVFMWCTIVLMYCKRDTQLLQLELFARLFSDVLLCISINSKQRTILFYHFCLSVHWMLILCQDECTCRQTFSTNTLVFPCYIWPWNSNRKGPLTVPNF